MEKYGTIPPRFTKEWWEHYWTYYKFHFLGGIFLIFIISSITHTILTQINYDLTLNYIASEAITEDEQLLKLENLLAELSSDVTKNGKTEISIQTSTFMDSNDPTAVEYNTASSIKLIGDLETASTQVYIVNKASADVLISYDCLIPVSEWANTYSEDSIYENTLLSLSGNKTLEGMGFNTQDLYIGVYNPRERSKKDQEIADKFKNAVIVAGSLIKE